MSEPTPEDPPDTSWMTMEGVGDGPPVLAWAMFLLTLMLVAATIMMLFH